MRPILPGLVPPKAVISVPRLVPPKEEERGGGYQVIRV